MQDFDMEASIFKQRINFLKIILIYIYIFKKRGQVARGTPLPRQPSCPFLGHPPPTGWSRSGSPQDGYIWPFMVAPRPGPAWGGQIQPHMVAGRVPFPASPLIIFFPYFL